MIWYKRLPVLCTGSRLYGMNSYMYFRVSSNSYEQNWHRYSRCVYAPSFWARVIVPITLSKYNPAFCWGECYWSKTTEMWEPRINPSSKSF